MTTLKTTLEQWRVLKAIIDHGGYAQAALALHRSQSSVSYAVARLQEQLGVELLVIEGRRARLTANGQALLAEAAVLLAEAQKLEQRAARLEQGWEAEVRLVVDSALPTPMLLQALSTFNRSAASTRVQLTEAVLSGAEEALLAQRADIFIGTRLPAGYLGELLLDVEFIAVAHPEHALHCLGRDAHAGDLKREMQIVVRDSGQASPRDEGWLGARQRWTVTSMETSAALVGEGMGFAWLPRHVVQQRLAEGRLKPLPLNTGLIRKVSLFIAFGDSASVGPAARRLAQALVDAAATMQQ